MNNGDLSSTVGEIDTGICVKSRQTDGFQGHFKWHLRRQNWIVLDAFLAAVAVLLALIYQPGFSLGWRTADPLLPGVLQAELIYPWFVLLAMHIAGMHDPLGDRRRWFALLRVIFAVAGAVGLFLFVPYLVSLHQIGRFVLLRTFFFSVGFLGGARILLWQWAKAAPKRIGCIMSQDSLARFCGLINKNHIPLQMVTIGKGSELQTPSEVALFFLQQEVDEVVVNSHDNRRDVWLACLNRGMPVTDVTVFVEREYYKVACDDTDMTWFIVSDLKWTHPLYNRVKRLLDLFVSSIGLVLSAPIILLGALAIIVEEGRPVFYFQTRVGFRGTPYRLWKLRTMRIDAEREGAQWAKQGDSRVTHVGRILRRTRVDELPQFWNVLKGEMSIIGPRPERPEFVEQLSSVIPLYPQRHWIKPGISGWAQINYPYGASVDDAREKLCYDLYYLKNASLLLDVHIALRTLGVIMKGSR